MKIGRFTSSAVVIIHLVFLLLCDYYCVFSLQIPDPHHNGKKSKPSTPSNVQTNVKPPPSNNHGILGSMSTSTSHKQQAQKKIESDHAPPQQPPASHNSHSHQVHFKPETFHINPNWTALNPHGNEIVAFYNLYIGNEAFYPNIVQEQLQLMNMTGLFNRLDMVYYVTIGNRFESMPKPIQDTLLNTKKVRDPHSNPSTDSPTNRSNDHPMFIQLQNTIKSVDETLTLTYLYDFCSHYPNSKVLYFHDKGSHNYRGENIFFRHYLDCYVLNPQCIEALDEGYDICGMRLSPLPNPHYSGNFWWARCDYVNKLVHPASMYINQTFAAVTKELDPILASHGRYLPESWIGSYPIIKPADCLREDIDTTFFCCYDLANIKYSQCPNHARHVVRYKEDLDDSNKYNTIKPLLYKNLQDNIQQNNGKLQIGNKCSNSVIFSSSQRFSRLYVRKRGQYESDMILSNRTILLELSKRSIAWYGQDPQSLFQAIEQMESIPAIPKQHEALLIEPNRQVPYFYYKAGKLYEMSSNEFKLAIRAKTINKIEKIPMYWFMVKKLQQQLLQVQQEEQQAKVVKSGKGKNNM